LNEVAMPRLSSCGLIEAHGERLDAGRRYVADASMALLDPTPRIALPTRTDHTIATPELATA
jgi:hypothetical protein